MRWGIIAFCLTIHTATQHENKGKKLLNDFYGKIGIDNNEACQQMRKMCMVSEK